MNLPAPPEPPAENADLQQMRNYIEDISKWNFLLYEFLKFPVFHVLKFAKRSDAPTEDVGGTMYYSDDEKLKCHNDTDWQNCY